MPGTKIGPTVSEDSLSFKGIRLRPGRAGFTRPCLRPLPAAPTTPSTMDTNLFDSLAQTDGDGNTYWSARDLADAMGYAQWQNFQTPLARAMNTARNMNVDVTSIFMRSHENTGQAGRPSVDYRLSRFAAYLVTDPAGGRKHPLTSAFYVTTNTLSRDNSRQRFPYQCTMGA